VKKVIKKTQFDLFNLTQPAKNYYQKHP